jgi:TP901 family phage tail tape measure protein
LSGNRNVKVILSAEIAGFKRGMEEAAAASRRTKQATEDTGKSADTMSGQLVRSATQNRDAWDRTGSTFLKVGAVTAAGLGMATKAAMSWESAWTGVQKTNDGTSEQMNQLEGDLRNLAKTLPATHEEIAGVAEAAGQLGIQVPNVAAFTKTMIDLGESTNLSADEAATGLARFSNVMGTSQDDVGRLGSTLVGLGNNFATTESEILAMSMRLSGAGKQAGLTEGEVMGLGAAMSSVGIEAEAGGSAMSITMKRIGKAVEEGGSSLDLFAKTSGMSSEQFSAAWKDDAAGALTAFVGGLAETESMGMSTNAVLTELGITGIREADALLRLSSATDVLSSAMKQGNVEFESNTALLEEASKRYETTESKIKIAWNNIKDAAIEGGAAILPVVASLAEGAADLAQFFGGLPKPVQGGITAIAGIAAVGTLAAGAFLTLFPRVMDTVGAFKTLATDSPKAAAGLSKVGKAAVGAMAIVGVGIAIAKIAEGNYMSKIDTGMGKVSLALAKIEGTGPGAAKSLDDVFKNRDGEGIIGDVTDLESAIDRTFNQNASQKFDDWGQGLVTATTGIKGSAAVLEDSWKRIDTGLSDMVSSGSVDEAKEKFKALEDQMISQGVSTEEIAALFPQFADSLANMAAEQVAAGDATEGATASIEEEAAAAEDAARASEEMQEALADIGLSADGTIASLQTFIGVLQEAGLLQLSARDASRGFQASIDEIGPGIDGLIEKYGGLGGVLNDAGTDFNDLTEVGRDAGAMFDNIAKSGAAYTQALADNGASQEELTAAMQGTYDALIGSYELMGITGEAADTLARGVMGIPEGVDITTYMDEEALRRAEDVTGAIEGIPDPTLSTEVITGQLTALHEKIQATPDKTVTITEPMSPTIMEALRRLGYTVTTLPDGTIQVTENGAAATGATIDAVATKQRIATIAAEAATWAAESALNHTARPRSSLITVNEVQGSRVARTGQNLYNAVGNFVQPSGVQFNAEGTFNQLSPMSPAAQVVPPNTWRVVGDNMTVPEVYAPLNGSQRSLEIMRLGADHMGYAMIPKDAMGFASGGVASRDHAPAMAHAGVGSMRMSATIDPSGIEAAMGRAMAGWQPVVQIDGRDFKGLMVNIEKRRN